MIKVVLGTGAAVEAYRNAVDPAAFSLDALLVKAATENVNVEDIATDKAAIAARLSAVVYKRALPGNRTVVAAFPDDMPLMECAQTITVSKGIWDCHSPGGFAESGVPLWVTSDSPGLASLIAEHYGCTVGAPDLSTYVTQEF